ncbi:MAG: GspH/FimT family pseudopilin [Proteobacteria bacterium]|jgi:type IV fimbrial biogenesis protein FimT|nr:GspH/FimT family pseudopilin [Ramlibacter sp.]MCA0214081.1 GspH/FimT family pseudopilin [Pseudomonadota bacterium]
MKKSLGFTLIELLVTLSILATLVTLAAPSVAGLVQSGNVASAVNTFLADLRFARAEAIRRGSAVVICRSDDPEAASPACTNTSARGWADGWIVYEERDGADGLGGGDKLLRIQAPLTGVDGASSAKTDFTFTPLGRSQSASVNVVFGVGIPPERRRKICIGFTGRARLAADASADCNS